MDRCEVGQCAAFFILEEFIFQMVQEENQIFFFQIWQLYAYSLAYFLRVYYLFSHFQVENFSSSVSAENHLAAIVGENVTISFILPFLDFCPKTMTTVYEIKAQGMIALRTWLPPKSPLYSVLHSLLKCTSVTSASSTVGDLPAALQLAQVWYSFILSVIHADF